MIEMFNFIMKIINKLQCFEVILVDIISSTLR